MSVFIDNPQAVEAAARLDQLACRRDREDSLAEIKRLAKVLLDAGLNYFAYHGEKSSFASIRKIADGNLGVIKLLGSWPRTSGVVARKCYAAIYGCGDVLRGYGDTDTLDEAVLARY